MVMTENKTTSSPATTHATVLPAKLQNARATSKPLTKIIRRMVQYLRLIWLRNSALRLSRAICLSSCSKRAILVIRVSRMTEHKLETPLDQLQAKAAGWKVTLDETRETPTSLLGFGSRVGRRVVIKLSKYAGDESHSGKVLEAFAGDGAVRVYQSETGAVLLERLEPGEQLVDVVKKDEDEEATKILAQVIGKLANHAPPIDCPTVEDWGRGFDRYVRSGDQQIPQELVREAGRLYQDLAATQRTTMLLHGDLQHYNVLFDDQRGWVAIDPKGLVGELEYEIGALLRSPVELPEVFANPATITRRLETLTTLLQLDHSRVLTWSFAQAILSAIWDVEDGYPLEANNPALLLAQALKPILKATKS